MNFLKRQKLLQKDEDHYFIVIFSQFNSTISFHSLLSDANNLFDIPEMSISVAT